MSYTPERIWAYAGAFKMWRDHITNQDHKQTEYIRKDKYDDLKKAADELVRAVGDLHESTGLSTYCLTSSLSAYRKATGDA